MSMRSKFFHHPIVRWLLRPLPLIIVASTLCFGGWFVFGSEGIWDSHTLRQRYERQERQIAELEERRDYVRQQLADLKSKDELALEQAARSFGLVAQGETVYEFKVDSVTTK